MKVEKCYFYQPLNSLGKYMVLLVAFSEEEMSFENFSKLLDDKWPVIKEEILKVKKVECA